MRLALALTVVVVTGTLPAVASAHVGRTLPVATDYTARITHAIAGVETKVVDGDQSLWLAARSSATVAIPGILGEPMLRFDARGVWLNLRSPTAQADRIDRLDLRPSATGQPPLWHRVGGGRSYLWHDHRLHALEPVARSRGSAGPWEVPVVVDGRMRMLRGVLGYTAPGPVWAWIVVPVALAVAATLAAVRSTGAVVGSALVATPAVWALRLGRELYGRPTVSSVGWLEIAITCAVGALLLFGLSVRNPGTRVFTAFFAGFGALYVALTMLPLLDHAIALNAIPNPTARVLEALVIVTGAGALGGSIFGTLRGEPG